MSFKKIQNKRVFVIAEIGSNFDQDINKAFKLIDVAKRCGADGVKFQLFQANKMYEKKKNPTAYNIFKSIELNPKWLPKLKKYAEKKKIIFFASAFDKDSVKVLASLKVGIIKIASSEITKLHELGYAASFKIPLIISAGMADLADISEAVEICKKSGNNQLCILHSSSLYPTLPVDVNMRNMIKLSKIFNLPVGYSDHTLGNTAAISAVSLGATVIEKHITLDKNSEGPDHFYAAEPDEFKKYIKDIRETEYILGDDSLGINTKVKKNARRKSIFLSKNIKKNEKLSKNNLIIKSDARGIEIRFLSSLYGYKVKNNLKNNSPLMWENINFQ
jgi:sialic acid synthase SpsE